MLAAPPQHFGNPAMLQQHDSMPKHDDEAYLHHQPTGPWSGEDYEQMMRNLFDAAPNSAGYNDIDAPNSMGFTASYPPSYVSGSSENGASPSSFNDFVYGAQNFPTPTESEISATSRNMSMSMQQPSSFSPNSNLEYRGGYAAFNDNNSPYNNMSYPSNSPYANSMPMHHPQSAPPSESMNNEFAQANGAQWNPNYLMPNALMHAEAPRFGAGLAFQHEFQPNVPTMASPPLNRKRSMADAVDVKSARRPSVKVAAKAAAKAAAAASAVPIADDERQSKKIKAEAPAKATTSYPISSKLPHMEVGSNATALAAIQRLKAKRLQEREDAVRAAKEAAARKALGPDSTSSPSHSEDSDKLPITSTMRQQKKVAHNAIERRYRNNINDRIGALRRAVPALREIRPRKTASGRKSRKAQQEEDLVDGVPAATKLNKATILGKATDYIRYLKSRELRLASEVAGLRELVRSLEGGEELLELWEGEMEKVVAEQEAFAAAAVAAEEEEEMEGAMDDEDDEDDEDEQEGDSSRDVSNNSGSSASPPSHRSTGRGRGGLSAVASSRYMLATFLGVTFIGGGAEFAIDSTASDASYVVARPATGRTVVGASRQLLKRSAAYVAPSAPIAQQAHHFDEVPSRVLAFEVLRVVSFAVCFLFLVWPLLAHVYSLVSPSRRMRQAEREEQRKQEMRAILADTNSGTKDIDLALRTGAQAPSSMLSVVPSLVKEVSLLGLAKVSPMRVYQFDGTTAVQARLLEVETTATDLAQPSYLLRLHTALKLANYQAGVKESASSPAHESLLGQARTLATLSIAFARLGEGVDFVQDMADNYWNQARAVLLKSLAKDNQDDSIDVATQLKQLKNASWLSTILALDLDTALELLPPTSSSLNGYSLSPLLSIADAHYGQQLETVWRTLLCSLIRSSCPTPLPSATLLKGFVSHQSAHKLDLDVINDVAKRDQLHAQIIFLARTAPPATPAWTLAQVTLASWSAVLGNLALAKHVALAAAEQAPSDLACVGVLNQFIDPSMARTPSARVSSPVSALDGLPTLFLSWLQFLRLFANPAVSAAEIHSATLGIRRLISAATSAGPRITEAADTETDDVEASADVLTDLCIVIGRRTAHLPDGKLGDDESFSLSKMLLESEGEDSGVEL